MSLQGAMYEELKADAGVSALVGARIYPVTAPQEADLPLLTLQRIDRPRERHQGGDAKLPHPRIQVNCWAETEIGADQLAEAVRGCLDEFSGVMGGREQVELCHLEDDSQEYVPPTDGSEQGTHGVRMDFIIWYREP